jgi:hypothetical protein
LAISTSTVVPWPGDLEPGLPGDVGQAPADGAVDRVHPGLLGVAVVPDQPAGQLQVLQGEDQGVEVAVGQDQAAAGAQHPDRLGHQGRRVGEDLQHVVAEHPVEGGVGQGQGHLQVGLEQEHAGRRRQAGDRVPQGLGAAGEGGGAQVDPDQQPARHRRGRLGQGGAGAAAQVDHPVAGHGA